MNKMDYFWSYMPVWLLTLFLVFLSQSLYNFCEAIFILFDLLGLCHSPSCLCLSAPSTVPGHRRHHIIICLKNC